MDVQDRAAAFDISDFGRLRITGDDAIDLLNRLSTNDLELITAGGGAGTVLTTNKGRTIDLLRVLRRDDHLLVITSPGTQQRVAEWIDFYTFAEDVSLEDVTGSTSHWLVVGAGAAECVDAAGFESGGLEGYLDHRVVDDGSTIIRGSLGSLTAYELIVPRETGPPDLGVEVRVQADLARLRVEQGVPAHPNEMNEDRNPLESNLKPHISFNKGCYIGQEVVARLDTYDRVQRYLCQLVVDDGSTVDAGSAILVDGKEVGEVTSAAPGLALAFLRKRFYEDGGTVIVRTGDRLTAATVRDIRPPEYND